MREIEGPRGLGLWGPEPVCGNPFSHRTCKIVNGDFSSLGDLAKKEVFSVSVGHKIILAPYIANASPHELRASRLFNSRFKKSLIDYIRGKTAFSFYCFSRKLLSQEEVSEE